MKNILKHTMLIAALIFCFKISHGQISQGGTPYSFKSILKSTADKDTITLSKDILSFEMPKIREQVIDSIKQNNTLYKEHQFAYGFSVDIDVKSSATIDSLEVGLLYRLAIKSEGAKSLNLIFKKYRLPKGAKLYIYSKDQHNIIGAFTSNNNKHSERLPTFPVFGDEITVEYFEPYYTNFTGQLSIGEVNHDFIGVVSSEGKIEDDFGSSGDCQVDINCSEGNNWQTEKRAVCRIIKNGKTHCTGTLLNNTNYDGTPYFLTANHCISSQHEADDCIFIFNYESPSCGGGDGSTSQQIAGGTLRATRSESDFALLELSLKPLSTWSPHFAGWDNRNTSKNNVVGIHHPSGDVKKICVENNYILSTQYLGNIINNTYNHWEISDWDIGVTEGGSSGSALFDNNHRVIGQLHGGYAACSGTLDNNQADWYGKFSTSWDEGSSANRRLKDWLDPTNSDVTFLDGANACTDAVDEDLSLTHTVNSGVVEIQLTSKTITSTSHIKSGATVTYEAGQAITLKPGFKAETGSNFTARIKHFDCVPTCHPMSIDVIPNFFTPNGDGINDDLCYTVSNATSYEFWAYNRWGNLIHSSSGSVSGNKACVWDGTDGCNNCVYYVILTFYSDCEEISEAYNVHIFIVENKKMEELSGIMKMNSMYIENDTLINPLLERDFTNFDFEIFPNPTDGIFTIEVKSKEKKHYSFELINSTGEVLYRIESLSERRININKTEFPSGIYYVRLSNGECLITKKLIIQ